MNNTLALMPLKGAEVRGSKPTCVGLDGPRNGRVSRPCGLQGTLAAGQSPIRGVRLATLIQTPCFRLAWMKTSRSPSSTFCVLLISTLVRRSLMRLLSST